MKTPIERRAHKSLRLAAAGALLPLALVLGTVVLPGTATAAGGSVSLVAYSTPKPAFAVMIKDFNATKAGAGVTFSQSFGASGTQATAVVPACRPTSSTSPSLPT